MAALTADRNTPEKNGELIVLPAAAAKKFYVGALAALDAAGRATPGATATTIKGLGRVEKFADNSAGSAGAIDVTIRRGIFRFANSAAGDAIAATEIGSDCFIVDDQTVAKTNGTNTRSVAGRVMDVDAQGVWVRLGL
jgi:hypothetical protein